MYLTFLKRQIGGGVGVVVVGGGRWPRSKRNELWDDSVLRVCVRGKGNPASLR